MTQKHLKYKRIAILADELQAPRTTLLTAFRRGEIAGAVTGCGLPLLDPQSAADWLSRADERSPGRKPAAAARQASAD